MKKIITVCLLSVLMLAGNVKAGNNSVFNVTPGPSASFAVWVKVIITFHRPKFDCQTGFGLCFDIQFGTEKGSGYTGALCPAQVRINAAGQLELMVAEADLLQYENGFALSYFKSGSLTFEDPYTFSDAVTKLLGSDRNITIKPGTYPVVHDVSARTYTVVFPI